MMTPEGQGAFGPNVVSSRVRRELLILFKHMDGIACAQPGPESRLLVPLEWRVSRPRQGLPAASWDWHNY